MGFVFGWLTIVFRQREKVLRGNDDPLAAVFSWGVRYHVTKNLILFKLVHLIGAHFKPLFHIKAFSFRINDLKIGKSMP